MTSAVVPSEPRSPSGRLAKPGGSRVGHVRRYGEIVRILVKYGFVDVVDALHLRAYLTAGRRVLSALGHDGHPDPSRAVRLRLAFEELGPTFIKFGQALSTHSDLLPAEVIAELTRLQDTVPPLQPGVAEKAIEDALGCGITDVFLAFEPEPIAAVSIAQVHRATLYSGEVVAVKVRRPGIASVIEADVAILADLASLAERYVADASLYSVGALVEEFARTIRREQDLVREGRLIERIASQFAGDPTVRFPRVCWPLSTPAVLTMEFVDAIKPVTTIEAVGRQLDPTFKIVEHATPFVQSLIEQKYTPEALALRTAKAGRDVLSGLRTLPANLAEITRKIRADGMQVQFVHRNLDFFVREMDRSSNRLSFAVVIAAIVIGSSIIVHASVGPQAFGYPLLGLAGFVTAGVLGIGLALGILRSGRL